MRSIKIKKSLRFFTCLLLVSLMLFSSLAVSAKEPYMGYNYTYDDDWGSFVAGPNSYLPTGAINGKNVGTTHFKKPTDIFVDEKDYVYVVDSGNNRIVKITPDLKEATEIANFTFEGAPSNLNNPTGIYVTKDGEMYIADKGNGRVVAATQDGEIKRVYGRPETPLLSNDIKYEPSKIIVNAAGDLYVLADNVNQGAFLITEDNEFVGFYGAELAKLSWFDRLMLTWRIFMTQEQIDRLIAVSSIEFNNMFVDGDFIYTVTSYQGIVTGQVRKLNPAGVNLIAADMFFGDDIANFDPQTGQVLGSVFTDITIDKNGHLHVLDKSTRKIYAYNVEGQQYPDLLSIYGQKGEDLGQLKDPRSIESVGDKILVLDYEAGAITVYEPTIFGKTVTYALYLYNHGEYEKALEPWKEVQKMNSNYDFAYVGIGRALHQMGEYDEAMKNFKLANNSTAYSLSKKEARTNFLRDNFTVLFTILVVLGILFWIFLKNKTKLRKKLGWKTLDETGYAGMPKWKYPFYIVMHPYDGFSEMKNNNKWSLPMAIGIVAVWFVSSLLIRAYEDFAIYPGDPDKVNVIMMFISTVVFLLLACVANWAFCTLMDGKGKFKEIFISAAYSMIPSTIATIAMMILSQFIIKEESIYISIILWISQLWTAIMILIGTGVVHEFTAKKSILMLILTGVGIMLILFLVLLLNVLFNQVVDFGQTIVLELIYRFGM